MRHVFCLEQAKELCGLESWDLPERVIPDLENRGHVAILPVFRSF
jgi:hypothetical protein